MAVSRMPELEVGQAGGRLTQRQHPFVAHSAADPSHVLAWNAKAYLDVRIPPIVTSGGYTNASFYHIQMTRFTSNITVAAGETVVMWLTTDFAAAVPGQFHMAGYVKAATGSNQSATAPTWIDPSEPSDVFAVQGSNSDKRYIPLNGQLEVVINKGATVENPLIRAIAYGDLQLSTHETSISTYPHLNQDWSGQGRMDLNFTHVRYNAAGALGLNISSLGNHYDGLRQAYGTAAYVPTGPRLDAAGSQAFAKAVTDATQRFDLQMNRIPPFIAVTNPSSTASITATFAGVWNIAIQNDADSAHSHRDKLSLAAPVLQPSLGMYSALHGGIGTDATPAKALLQAHADSLRRVGDGLHPLHESTAAAALLLREFAVSPGLRSSIQGSLSKAKTFLPITTAELDASATVMPALVDASKQLANGAPMSSTLTAALSDAAPQLLIKGSEAVLGAASKLPVIGPVAGVLQRLEKSSEGGITSFLHNLFS